MSKDITWGNVYLLLLWHNICSYSCALHEHFIIMKSCKIWRKDKAIKCTMLTATTQARRDGFFFCLILSLLMSISSVFTALKTSRMESVTIILLRYECVKMGVPFFCQMHSLVHGGRDPACLLDFLILKDWNISPDFALECAMCAVL